MIVTTFSAKSSQSKIPYSPFGNKEFIFERIVVQDIKQIFDKLASRFVLGLPLKKKIKATRSIIDLDTLILPEIDYIILDVDKLKSHSDRELALEFFRNSPWELILGESRNPFNLKGVLKVERMPWQQGKDVLKSIQEKINRFVKCKVDQTATNRVSYQAPINKHNVLLHKDGIPHPRPTKQALPVPSVVKVSNEIEQLCIDAFVAKGFSFNKVTQDGFQCSHFTENKTPNGFSWRRSFPYDMTHWNPDRKASVWDEVRVTDAHKKQQKEHSKALVKEIMPVPPVGNRNQRYLDNCTEEVADFINNKKLLKISSPMGTAKSTVIEEVVHQARKNELRILFITNRISLAEDICKKYDDLKYYLGTDVENNKYSQGDDLVVQIDSLHKFKVKLFDLVIIDEAATTLMHLLTLEKHLVQTSKQVFSLKQKKIVLADAFLFDDMVEIFAQKSDTTEINNSYKDNVKLEFYIQKDNFIQDLIEEAKIRPVTFSSGSNKVLDVVAMLAELQQLKTLTISAGVPKKEKELIYAQMQKKKANYDILMYSPTLTVGVSNVNKISTHYHYDTGQSMNVLSSVQMVKRTRSATKIRMFIHESIQYNPVNLSKIQSSLDEFHDTDDYGDSIGVSETGREFSHLQRIHNVMENRHKVAFLELLKMQFIISPKNVSQNQIVIPTFFGKFSKLVDKQKKDENLELFEEFRGMSPEELQDEDYLLFGTSKVDLIRSFQDIKTDETLDLSSEQLDDLIREEIQNPGIVQMYKTLISTKRNHPTIEMRRIISKNKKLDYNKLGIDITEMGYKKDRNLWVLNETLHEFENSHK